MCLHVLKGFKEDFLKCGGMNDFGHLSLGNKKIYVEKPR